MWSGYSEEILNNCIAYSGVSGLSQFVVDHLIKFRILDQRRVFRQYPNELNKIIELLYSAKIAIFLSPNLWEQFNVNHKNDII